jgi:hypothetical protein
MSAAIEENENCEATHATFRICGDMLIPQEISARIGLSATFACAKGDMFKSGGGLATRPIGVWLLRSENVVVSTSLERHLIYLVEILESVEEQIKYYVDNPDYQVDFLCYWVSATGHGGPIFSSKLMKKLSALCNEMNFDFYGPYDD